MFGFYRPMLNMNPWIDATARVGPAPTEIVVGVELNVLKLGFAGLANVPNPMPPKAVAPSGCGSGLVTGLPVGGGGAP